MDMKGNAYHVSNINFSVTSEKSVVDLIVLDTTGLFIERKIHFPYSTPEFIKKETRILDIISFNVFLKTVASTTEKSITMGKQGVIAKIRGEFPEIFRLYQKLKRGERLSRLDLWNLNEVKEGSGWADEDIKEELMNLDKDPSEREERYYQLFLKYYREAEELKGAGDYLQAAEKIWGAITALIKAYFSRKGVYVAIWSRSKLDKTVENNVEERYRSLFYDLLTYGGELHEHFYEKRIPKEKFERRWGQCIELIERIKSIYESS